MKNQANKSEIAEDFMREEYNFDYSKGVRGRYSRQATEENGYVMLVPEVRKVFKTSEGVNNALLAIINAYPKNQKRVTK